MDNQHPFRFKFRVSNLTPEAEDDLAESAEMYFSQHIGVDFVVCYEEGPDAIKTARQIIAKLRNHYVHVERLEPDFVTRTEIADRADVKRQAVSLWVTGKRKSDFPAPSVSYGGGLWYWPDVQRWLVANDVPITVEDQQPSIDEIDTINGFLNRRTSFPEWSNSPKDVTTLAHSSGAVNVHSVVEQRVADYLQSRTSETTRWRAQARRAKAEHSTVSTGRAGAHS